MKQKINGYQICLIALAIVINVVGGQLALALRLPVYLDSIGTILIGTVLGPWAGLLPGLLGGIVMALTGDIYSLYFAPVGMIVGFMSGIAYSGFTGFSSQKRLQHVMGLGRHRGPKAAAGLLGRAVLISLPGTIVSALICAAVFGGITSSGSAVLVQLLAAKTPLNLTASIIAVQLLTDYLDRVISLFLVMALLRVLPGQIKQNLIHTR